jgi:hypothetical protein
VLSTNAANPNGGVDVVFADELRANIQKDIESNCVGIDAQCVGSVSSLLLNPRTELESQQAALIIVGAELFALIAIAIHLCQKDRNEGAPIALHIPSAQLDPAASDRDVEDMIRRWARDIVGILCVRSSVSVTPSRTDTTVVSTIIDVYTIRCLV